MLSLGALSFLAPMALSALLALPVIWWLLRLTPPLPTIIRFPPVRLLLGLTTREESAAHTPLWLLILRLILAALVILAAAHPLLNADTKQTGKGSLIVIIDDGWAAGGNWQARRDLLSTLVDQAERDARPVIAVTTAPGEDTSQPSTTAVMTAADARQMFLSLQPKPWATDRSAALQGLMQQADLAGARPGDVVWLSDGLEENHPAKDMAAYLQPLQRFGGVTLVRDPGPRLAMVLRPPVTDAGALIASAERASPKGMAAAWLRVLGDDGRLLAREAMTFAAGKTEARVTLALPTEMLNSLQRLEIEDAGNAAAVVLTDERWRRRPVGLVSGASSANQPLLSDLFYLERALKPFTEIRIGNVAGLLKRPLAVMVLSDPGQLGASERKALENWIEAGGVAVRFAGPLLAKETVEIEDNGNGPLLPVRLRRGDRVIGGTMSWGKPAKLAPFDAASPFHGLDVPSDVSIKRQVLAQPSLELVEKTWAHLDDGTPLVTAERRAKGWLVLVHTSANPQWSNLPLSGLFVGMLKKLVGLSQGVAAKASGPPLEALSMIDGFGRLGGAAAHARAIPADAFDEAKVSPAHPPGFYGSKNYRRALNLSETVTRLSPVGELPGGVSQEFYGKPSEFDFRPWLLLAALVLVLVDFTTSLGLRGLLPFAKGASRAAGVAAALWATSVQAGDDAFALGNSLETRLAYVITGDKQIDDTSRAGLYGLNVVLKRRTAAELGPPQGVQLSQDELSFFPLLYWPVAEHAGPLPEKARANVNTYLKNGGTILFDTRSTGGSGSDNPSLATITRGLDIPPLVPVPVDHVLTRAFYLLREFPGRWTGGTLWVERAGERVNDGVSPVIVGGHEWAAAWALDESQRPLFPVVPGGERQREMAFRFGVNLVMYTLTGNYKADQVHMPAIIKRLGK
ncbi:MAG: DUF4159 domain-containing protein [Rhodospirillales bacterium]